MGAPFKGTRPDKPPAHGVPADGDSLVGGGERPEVLMIFENRTRVLETHASLPEMAQRHVNLQGRLKIRNLIGQKIRGS